jgi:hypothetical protein
MEQSARRALRRRMLGDQIRGKVEIEFIEPHDRAIIREAAAVARSQTDRA